MLTLPTPLLAAAQSGARAYLYGAKVADWNGTDVRYASAGEDVLYPAGTIWDGRRFDLPELTAGEDTASGLTLVVEDVLGVVLQACLAANPQGCRVTLYKLWMQYHGAGLGEEDLGEADLYEDASPLRAIPANWSCIGVQILADGLEIGEIGYGDRDVTFALRPPKDEADRQSPGITYAPGCWYEYRAAGTCAYAGAEPGGETTCDHTHADCKLRGNQARYPGHDLLTSRRY